jgi:hypothetical protein
MLHTRTIRRMSKSPLWRCEVTDLMFCIELYHL